MLKHTGFLLTLKMINIVQTINNVNKTLSAVLLGMLEYFNSYWYLLSRKLNESEILEIPIDTIFDSMITHDTAL